MSTKPFKIALVAGEASSDMIGASLIQDLFAINPEIECIAVGGKHIKATAANIIRDNEVFSVMGLVEVLKDLPHLLQVKRQIVKTIIDFKPDVFIGVDSPDLNFSIAKSLKQHNIPVVHYVSPSVWAWRPKRVFKMQYFIDCLLTLFPFEVELYQPTSIAAKFVGHPLAQKIPLEVDKSKAKQAIGKAGKQVLALLPGSRNREIKTLVPIFASTIKQLNLGDDWVVMSCNVSQSKVDLVKSLADDQQLSIEWVDDASALLQAADFALLGSGTVALESMLCKTPMVVAYQISKLTWQLVKTFKLMQLPYYSLPNVLQQGFMVPEVMQNDLTVENLAAACNSVMQDPNAAELIHKFTILHKSLLPAQPQQAAKAVLAFMDKSC